MSDDELRDYVALYESATGRWMSTIMREAITEAFQAAGARFAERASQIPVKP